MLGNYPGTLWRDPFGATVYSGTDFCLFSYKESLLCGLFTRSVFSRPPGFLFTRSVIKKPDDLNGKSDVRTQHRK